MQHTNIEIKAKCFYPKKVKAFLLKHSAHFEGTNFQKDLYFNVPDGRLKLRSGNIENNLIFYKRDNQKGPKKSNFLLVPVAETAKLELLLTAALGIKVIVEKKRKIYYLENIKVHVDEISSLGCFVEIEAGNLLNPAITVDEPYLQCAELMKHFEIKEEDLIEGSYSDMMLSKNS